MEAFLGGMAPIRIVFFQSPAAIGVQVEASSSLAC